MKQKIFQRETLSLQQELNKESREISKKHFLHLAI